MIENNLIIELLKIEIKENRIYPQNIYLIRINDNKKILDKLTIGLTLDVSGFDCDLVQVQLEELIRYKMEHTIGKSTVLGGLINNIVFNHAKGIVKFTMFKYYFEDLKKKCFISLS